LQYPETIEMDYTMQDGALKVNVRAAVAGYMLRRWNVDCTEDHSLKGQNITFGFETDRCYTLFKT